MNTRYWNRRHLIGAALLATSVTGRTRALARQGDVTIDVSGDCQDFPAVVHLHNFVTGNFTQLPYRSVDELLPGIDWQLFQSVELGPFLVPPDWTAGNYWANTFDDLGMPEWQSQPVQFPFWSMTAVLSPDQRAGYIYVTGLVKMLMTPEDGADLSRMLVAGATARGEEVCVIKQVEPQYSSTSVQWLGAHLYGTDLLLSKGFAILSDVSGPDLGSGSHFALEVMVSPAKLSEDYMREIFLPIMWQFVPRGGDDATPTPTPTAEAWRGR